MAWVPPAGSDPDLVAGRCARLSPLVARLVAPNPGPFTGAGTNTYFVGREQIAVVDPGPPSIPHVEAILAAVPGPIAWILVTHSHEDHSPAARLLRERTGATVVGRRPPDAPYQDRRFRPDAEPADGERVLLDGATLRAIATPGHASNHVCFLLEEEDVLFTGDHVLGGVTPVILPPDGDMADYLDSLARLRALGASRIAPGHGPMLDDPVRVIDGLVAHRLGREKKVLAAVGRLEPASLDELLPVVYDDVPQSLHPLARNSLLAHLIKLVREGSVVEEGERWRTRG